MTSSDPSSTPKPSTTRATRPAAALAAAALLGGGVAVGAAWLAGAFDEGASVTVVERQSVPASTSGTGSGRELSVQDIYRKASPAVVQITADVGQDGVSPTGQALGSGFVIDRAGYIVTNHHVVDGAAQIRVSFSNENTVEASLVGTDAATDIALLKVDLPASALTALTLADSDALVVGDPVVAIGNPFGLERTATAGIVSALQRAVTSPSGAVIDHVIQTDAPINHGNSGGPLLDTRGRVIGVNSQIETGGTGDGNVGIGFAVPSNTVRTVVAQLRADGKVERAFLGVAARPIEPELARAFNLPVTRGLIVESVTDGSGAARAGLEAGDQDVVVEGQSYKLGGDVIVAAAGQPVQSIADLRDVVTARKPGEKIELEVYRDGSKKTLTVTLGSQPQAS
jgi:S1-C subfamily serine protease